MRIVAARVRPLVLRFARPLRTARGEFAERHCVLLELQDERGLIGYGEAAPWTGFTAESAEQAAVVLQRICAGLPGSALEPAQWPDDLAQRLRSTPTARAALAGALWDLAARRADRPLAQQLAVAADEDVATVLERVPVSALLVDADPAGLHAHAAQARRQGHAAVKIKLGASDLATDLGRARAVRQALGPAVRLRGDANGAWRRDEARAALEALAELDFEYVEQPLPAGDVEGLAELRRRALVPIAADESVATEQGVLRVIDEQAADVVILKPAMLGGAWRTLQLARQARRAGLVVVFTHALESAVGARHTLHCAAAWGDPAGVHGLATAGLFDGDVATPVAAMSGSAHVGREPGIGIAP